MPHLEQAGSEPNEALKVLEEEVHVTEDNGVFTGTIDLSKRTVD